MRTIHSIIACLFGCLLLGCASTPSTLQLFHFDGSTEQTTKDSNNEIMKQLSERGKAEYLAALVRIQVYDRDQRRKSDPDARPGPLGRKIDGMTYQQIMDYSRQFPDRVVIVPLAADSSAKLLYTPEIRKMSFADDRLYRDLLNADGGTKVADEVFFPNAKVRRITKIETIVPYDNRKTGVERWTIQHDGQDTCSYILKFIPDGHGGTQFSVERDHGTVK